MNKNDQTKHWHLLELLERSLDGQLNAGEQAKLEATLRDDPEALTIAAKALHQHAELRYDQRLTRDLAHGVAPAIPDKKRGIHFTAAALSAAAAVAIVAVVTSWFVGRSEHGATVATVTKSQNCRWAGSTLPTAEGSRIGIGTLELAEGLATLRFDSGAEVVMEAPATIEIINAMSCRLKRGTVVAEVPPSAKGFTVDTPDAKVIDYGTRFGLSTGEDGKYMVQVLEGLVEVNHKASHEIKQLRAGQSVDRGLIQTHLHPQLPENEPNRWLPNQIMDAGDGWQVVSTAFGRGKDSYIQSGDKAKNFGRDPFFRVKRSDLQLDLNRKAYVAFDISKFKGKPITDAEFMLTIEPSDLGFATLVPDSKFAVYGLTDESEDEWDENAINWHSAPAHDDKQTERHLPVSGKVTLLGHFSIAQGVNRGTRSIRGQALCDFINRDTNGIVTLIICRETGETAKGGFVHAFATKENAANTPPLLRLKTE